jgi:UDP-N-acetylglucosamine 2-epimerase (non-hydrolysing)
MGKNKMRTFLVGGARPNFMKLAPLSRAMNKKELSYDIIHTGQHYDGNLTDIFFEEFDLKKPKYNLGVSNMSHAHMTAEIMKKFEDLCMKKKPDLVVVVGDINSTVACALVTSKIPWIKLAHIEAGARSFDRTMPEEINRIITDVLSDYLFPISSEHFANLIHEGIAESKIYLVGDTRADNLLYNMKKAIEPKDENYVLLTLHRQGNVDDKNTLQKILSAVNVLAEDIKVIFPLHPRTKNKIKNFHFYKYLENIKVVPPLGYYDFLGYMKNAKLILTDSGGIQFETTILNVPCLTLRDNTEVRFTLSEGTNKLVGTEHQNIIYNAVEILTKRPTTNLSKQHERLFDGKAAERIVDILLFS